MLFPPPDGIEMKPDFAGLPDSILRQFTGICGGRVASGDIAYGGLSASASFILTLKDGRKFFAKGTHPAEMAHGAANLRQEISTYENVAALRDCAPAYLGLASNGDDSGWMLGVWEYVGHDPKLATVESMVAALRWWQQDATAKKHLPPARQHNYIGQFFNDVKKWTRLRDEEKPREKFLSLFEDKSAAAQWYKNNIAQLCAAQSRVSSYKGVEGLLHGDLRRDNFLFTPSRTYAVDWPNACYGPFAFDEAMLGANLEALGLGRTEDLLMEPESTVPLLAAQAGYFADQAYRDVPTPMPRLRWMQKGMLLALLKSLGRLGIIESPPKMGGENQ